ncbi:hypothetical protein I7I48_01857 [Histoplasma ohiense]|nr:hypothetical protein I7I48_01857 [Histoplasma ohiense (nom. inval.)]
MKDNDLLLTHHSITEASISTILPTSALRLLALATVIERHRIIPSSLAHFFTYDRTRCHNAREEDSKYPGKLHIRVSSDSVAGRVVGIGR